MQRLCVATAGAILCLLAGCGAEARRLPLDDTSAVTLTNWQPVAESPGVFRTAGTQRARIRFGRPWSGDSFVPPAPLAIVLEYRDTLDTATILHLCPFNASLDEYVGHFGGEGDGQWKEAVFVVDPETMGADREGMCEISIGRPGKHVAGDPPRNTATPGLEVRAVRIEPASRELMALSRDRRWKAWERLRSDALAGLTREGGPQERPADLPEEFARLGFIPFRQPDGVSVKRHEAPPRKRWGLQTVRLRAAAGEMVAASLGVHALKDLSLQPTATSLEAANGDSIGGVTLQHSLHSAERKWDWDPESRRRTPSKNYRLVENWLPAIAGPLKLAAGESSRLRLTVQVPPDARPGLYRGRINLGAAGADAATDVELTVLPFALDTLRQHNVTAGVFTGAPSKRAELADMAEHGLNSHMIFYDAFPFDIRNDGGKVAIDWTRWNWWVRQLKAAGLDGPLVIVLGNDSKGFLERHLGMVFDVPNLTRENFYVDIENPRLADLYVQALQSLVANAKANDWPEVVLLPYDEPTERMMDQFRDRCRLIHEHLPGTRVYGVSMNRLSWAESIVESSDIIVSNGSLREIGDLCRRQGKELWTYSGGVGIPWDETAWVRMRTGIENWQLGATGRWWWAYHWTSTEPLLQIGIEEPGWVSAAYCSFGRPIPSVGYEAVRLAFDDWRYLLTLERLIAEQPEAKAARLARELLDQFRSAGDYLQLREALEQWLNHQSDRDRTLIADETDPFAAFREAMRLMIGRLRTGMPEGAGRMNVLAVSGGEATVGRDRKLRLVITETTGRGPVIVILKNYGKDLVPPFVLQAGQTREITLFDPADAEKSLVPARWAGILCRIDKGRAAGDPAGSAKLACYSGDEAVWSVDTEATPAPLFHDAALELRIRDPDRRRRPRTEE